MLGEYGYRLRDAPVMNMMMLMLRELIVDKRKKTMYLWITMLALASNSCIDKNRVYLHLGL